MCRKKKVRSRLKLEVIVFSKKKKKKIKEKIQEKKKCLSSPLSKCKCCPRFGMNGNSLIRLRDNSLSVPLKEREAKGMFLCTQTAVFHSTGHWVARNVCSLTTSVCLRRSICSLHLWKETHSMALQEL